MYKVKTLLTLFQTCGLLAQETEFKKPDCLFCRNIENGLHDTDIQKDKRPLTKCSKDLKI